MLHVDDGGGTREGAPGGPSGPFLMVGGGGGTGGGQLPPYSLPISATVSLKAEQKCAQSVSAAQKIHCKAKKAFGTDWFDFDQAHKPEDICHRKCSVSKWIITSLPPSDTGHLDMLLGMELTCAAVNKSQPDAKLVHFIQPEL